LYSRRDARFPTSITGSVRNARKEHPWIALRDLSKSLELHPSVV
jgi:hypothetical protein